MIMMVIGGMLIGAPVKTWVDNITGMKPQRRQRPIYTRSVGGQESRT